jgi:hypothetical protein
VYVRPWIYKKEPFSISKIAEVCGRFISNAKKTSITVKKRGRRIVETSYLILNKPLTAC